MKEQIEQSTSIPADGLVLEGILGVPPDAQGAVVFVHGSGSSRFSPRNSFVASVLRRQKLATLLIDLLSPAEDQVYENRFDIDLLTERLVSVAQWMKRDSRVRDLPLGLFGASTGTASALRIAARLGDEIYAVVSRGGRPDLVQDILPYVTAPTLLIVGGNDDVVVELNRRACKLLQTEKKLSIIPGATHLFEEPRALEAVADQATTWFVRHLPVRRERLTPVRSEF